MEGVHQAVTVAVEVEVERNAMVDLSEDLEEECSSLSDAVYSDLLQDCNVDDEELIYVQMAKQPLRKVYRVVEY